MFLLSVLLFAGCGGARQESSCPDGSKPLQAKFDLDENPVVSDSPEKALERFLRQSDRSLQAESFNRLAGERRPAFGLDAEDVGPVRIDTTRLEQGWIVVAYEACRGTFSG